MFRTILGKECLQNPTQCKLTGQMQDAGLPLCPECAGELKPVKRVKKEAVLAVAVIGLLFAGVSSVVAYGRIVQGFTAQQTVKWIIGQLKRVDRLGGEGDAWMTGTVSWWTSDGAAKQKGSKYLLYERVNSQHQFRPDFTSDRNDRLRFELSPRTEYAYVLYRAPEQPMLLFPDKNSGARAPRAITVPSNPNQAIRLSGPSATEHFVFIASKKNVPGLEQIRKSQAQPDTSRLDAVIQELEQDTENAAVYHVMIPHK